MKKVKFSNGTMAEIFQDEWCWHCENDRAVWSCWDETKQQYTKEPEWEKGCQILARALGCEPDDSDYPIEFQRFINALGVEVGGCFAFVDKDNAKNAVSRVEL